MIACVSVLVSIANPSATFCSRKASSPSFRVPSASISPAIPPRVLRGGRVFAAGGRRVVNPKQRRHRMAVAVIQEFPIEGDDRTTTNYDRVQEALGTRTDRPAGGLVHTAGFDEEAGVFRVFDVWESREAWDAFLTDRL